MISVWLFPLILFFFAFLFHFLIFLFIFLCFLPFFFVFNFLHLCISSIHSEQMGRDLFSVTTPEEAERGRQVHGRPTPRSMSGASPNSLFMQYVVRAEQRIATCQSMLSEPLPSTGATTRMFTVPSEWPASASKTCLAVDGGGVSLTRGPVNKVKLIRKQKSFNYNKM